MRLARLATAAIILAAGWAPTGQAQSFEEEQAEADDEEQAQSYDEEEGLGHPDDGSTFRERVRNALNLTEEQTESLWALRSELQGQLALLRDQVEEGFLTAYDARAQYRRAMRVQRAGRDQILTADQMALLERARHFVEEERLADPRERQSRPRVQLAEALELTEEQKMRWQELLQEQRRGVQAMREEGEVLTREDILRLRGEHRKAFMAILTFEQAARLEEIREDWQRRWEEAEADVADPGIEAEAEEELGTAVEEESWETR